MPIAKPMLAGALLFAVPAVAADLDTAAPEILVTAPRIEADIANAPNSRASVTADTIQTRVNAVSVEDTLKYLPSLIVRKRHVGDNFAPIATRTSGLGSSARSLIFADGILLSALIANNNGNGSPKWQLVAPEEIDRIDVLYGPFSAAYSGNGIGTVVNITTRMPETLSATLTALGNIQHHEQYRTARDLETGQISGTIGDRIGRFAFFLAATHTSSNGQPVAYVTATTAPAGTSGAVPTRNRLGAPTQILGASDIDRHNQQTVKLKLAYDLTDSITASYTLGLFRDDSRADVDTYLRDGAGNPVYTSGFNSGFYLREQRHWAHALSVTGTSARFDWQVIGTLYDYDRDVQANPTALLRASATGGVGALQDQGGTGWVTLDARGAWRSAANTLSFGGHVDEYTLAQRTYASAAWRDFAATTLTAAALGKTRTSALWVQDEVRLGADLSLTLGGRQEWWEAFSGFSRLTAAGPGITQAPRRATGFSPKAALAWRQGPWRVQVSAAQAFRFPTVGELYGATTVGTVLTNPNPNLRPERARSLELALAHETDKGSIRLSLFNEIIDNALIAQTGTVGAVQPNGTVLTTTTSFVQNVDRTRARGLELAIDRRLPALRLDLAGSVTYADAITSANRGFPAAVGRLLPSVPRWKANAVVTWRPVERLSLTAAARYSSRNYATLDNSDIVADTWQGFDRFFVVDLRAKWQLNRHADVALGVDNLNNNRYFLFHPFPQRSVTAELHWRL